MDYDGFAFALQDAIKAMQQDGVKDRSIAIAITHLETGLMWFNRFRFSHAHTKMKRAKIAKGLI